MRKKMENENDCDILTPSSEEEIGYCSNLLRSHINWEKIDHQTSNYPVSFILFYIFYIYIQNIKTSWRKKKFFIIK